MRLFALSLMTIIAIAACNKKQSEASIDYADGYGLAGKWLSMERFVSPGSAGAWYPIPANQRFTIEFGANSLFNYSLNFPKADSVFNHYTVNGRNVNMTSSLTNKQDTWYLGDTTIHNELNLAIFLCIEGCAYKLVRVK